MRILSLHENWPHPTNPVAWIHAAEQLKTLANFCRVTAIVTPLQPVMLSYGDRRAEEEIPQHIQEAGFQVYRPRYWSIPRYSYRLNDYSKALSVMYTIFREGISFQLLHAHYVYRTGYVGSLVSRWLRKPLIITAHGTDVWRLVHEEELQSQVSNRSKAALTAASRVLAVSQDLKSMLTQLGYGNKTEVIFTGIPGSRFVVRDKIACRKRLGLPENKHFLLYVGHLIKDKGADILPFILKHVLQINQDLNLIIVGQGMLRTSMESDFRHLGLSPMVKFTGEIPNVEIGDYIGASDLLLMPSRHEGLGVAAMEALACGRPVIASLVGGLPEIVTDDTLGLLVEPENPIGFAEAIHQALRREWDSEVLHQSAQRFSWDNLAPQIISIFKDVLARKKTAVSGRG